MAEAAERIEQLTRIRREATLQAPASLSAVSSQIPPFTPVCGPTARLILSDRLVTHSMLVKMGTVHGPNTNPLDSKRVGSLFSLEEFPLAVTVSQRKRLPTPLT